VTIRHRDDMRQERIHINSVAQIVQKEIL